MGIQGLWTLLSNDAGVVKELYGARDGGAAIEQWLRDREIKKLAVDLSLWVRFFSNPMFLLFFKISFFCEGYFFSHRHHTFWSFWVRINYIPDDFNQIQNFQTLHFHLSPYSIKKQQVYQGTMQGDRREAYQGMELLSAVDTVVAKCRELLRLGYASLNCFSKPCLFFI